MSCFCFPNSLHNLFLAETIQLPIPYQTFTSSGRTYHQHSGQYPRTCLLNNKLSTVWNVNVFHTAGIFSLSNAVSFSLIPFPYVIYAWPWTWRARSVDSFNPSSGGAAKSPARGWQAHRGPRLEEGSGPRHTGTVLRASGEARESSGLHCSCFCSNNYKFWSLVTYPLQYIYFFH